MNLNVLDKEVLRNLKWVLNLKINLRHNGFSDGWKINSSILLGLNTIRKKFEN